MDEEAIAAVVKEIEEEQALNRVSAVQVFQSILNQPALLSVSSASATAEGSGDGYTGFTVNMPRPILQVKELELLTANIPLCTQNIPDTACVFWYYRLSLYSGKYPNPNNLFFVRLLPSYYKPEFIRNFENFGYNQTFNGYPDLAAQLALATTQDLAQVNFSDSTAGLPYYRIQYLNNDEVKLTYDSAINKFKFAGNFGLPVDEEQYDLVYNKYTTAATYAKGDIVIDTLFYVPGWGFVCYESKSDGNINNALPVYPDAENTYWFRNYNVEGVAPYSSTTAYKTGQFVERLNTLYRAVTNTYASQPPSANWEEDPDVSSDLYRYMATGPLDPNVAFMQGTSQRTWSPGALYQEQDTVLYKGITYLATRQNLDNEPFPVPNPTDNTYSPTRQYQVGDYVYLAGTPGVYYVNIKASLGISPTFGYFNNANWNHIEYDTARPTGSTPPQSQFYQVGDIVRYGSLYTTILFFKCIKANPPAGSLSSGDTVRYGANEYWVATYWNTGTSSTEVPYVGLAKISADLDMMDDLFGTIQYPFPEGIPPQPFNPDPKRLLNSILGFTWNGKFTPNQFDQLYNEIVVTGSSTITQLYNRLRPVPIYISFALSGPLTSGSVNLDPTITANGYANLVYTSVINIYASIAGGSTIDTIRNTNLIGTMAMNAGNLGIGFSAAYLNATLQTQDSDIYSISFSFTDEYGDPYPLTNNAVVTLTFRMGYKESKK
jgi:hypothetical protein